VSSISIGFAITLGIATVAAKTNVRQNELRFMSNAELPDSFQIRDYYHRDHTHWVNAPYRHESICYINAGLTCAAQDFAPLSLDIR